MATTHKWGSLGSKTTAISSSVFNNLADGAQKLSSAISNDTDLYLYMDVKLSLSATTANRTAGATMDMYLLYDLGDSAYSSGSTSLNPMGNTWAASFAFDASTGARVITIPGIQIYPQNFKILVESNLGVLLTCCTKLEYRRYYMQST